MFLVQRLYATTSAAVLALALVLGLAVAVPTQSVATSTPSAAAPKPPSKPSVTSYSNNAVRLTWSSVKGATSYEVRWASSSKLKKPSTLRTPAATAEIGGLKASRNYYFQVRALRADGSGLTKFSKTRKVKTRSKKSYSALSPAGFRASENRGDELTLTWLPQGSTNRHLLRWATKSSMKGAKSSYVTGTTWLLDGLKRATSYYFTLEVVSAKNKSLSKRTGPMKVTTAKLITFGTPTGVELSRVNPTDFTVSWAAVRKAPAYEVNYTAGSWANPEPVVVTNTTTIKLSDVVADTSYEVKVRAVDAAGQPAGEFSSVASAQTPSQDAELRVASYNVMCHNCDAKGEEAAQPWTIRRDAVVSTITGADPDVVSLQEARQSWLDDPNDDGDKKLDLSQFEDLLNRLNATGGKWALTNQYRNNCVKSTTPTNCVYQDRGAADDVRIAYRSDRIKLLKDSSGATRQGSLRLPDKPADQPEWIDPSPKARYMAWAFLQQASTGKKFLMVDVHFEPRNDDDLNTTADKPDAGCGTTDNPICGRIRLAQARAVLDKIAELNTEALPVVMAGDVASSRREPGGNLPYLSLTAGGLIDPLRLATDSGDWYYTAATTAPAETRINIAFHSVNQYESAARCYSCRVNGVFDPTRLNQYNGAYNDYILVSPKIRTSVFEQVVNVDPATGNFIGTIPSDHNLIRASLWLP